MQYILTREELNDLVPKAEVQRRTTAIEESSSLILELSNFRCIHKRQEVKSPIHSGRSHLGYCDDCPLYTKFTRNVGIELLCTLPKNFSK